MYFGKEVKETPRGRARVNGMNNSGGLIFSSSGLTPRSHHPGEHNLPHPHMATDARASQDHKEAFEYCYDNNNNNAGGEPMPSSMPSSVSHPHSGIRHYDSWNQESAEEEPAGRSIHRPGVQHARGCLLPGSNIPRGTEAAATTTNPSTFTTPPVSSHLRMYAGATAADRSEVVLRRFLQDPDRMYRDAAQRALDTCQDASDLIEAEKRISHHKASKAFAEESAARRMAQERGGGIPSRMERESAPANHHPLSSIGNGNDRGGAYLPHGDDEDKERRMVGRGRREGEVQREVGNSPLVKSSPLGTMAPRLAQSTPFALTDYAAARPPDVIAIRKPASRYNNVTGNPLPRANYSSPSFLAHTEGGEKGGVEETYAQGSSHVDPKEENRPHAPAQVIPAPFTRAPFDCITATEEVNGRYPAPPPVGVRTGMWNKPLLVHHVHPGGVHQTTPDQDTVNFRKAQHARELHETACLPQTTSVGHTVICGSSMDGCEENLSDFNRRYNPQSTNQNTRHTAATLMEERCRARERELEGRRMGRRMHPTQQTSLW